MFQVKNTRKFTKINFIFVVVCCLFCIGKAAAQVYITNVVGDWHLSGNSSALSEGQTLPAGKRVNNPNSNAGDTIELVGGSQVWQISCGTQNTTKCRIGMVIPSTSITGRLWDTVMSYWAGDKEKYTVHIVRGDWIVDNVVKSEKDEADLTPLFKSMPDDTYYLKIKSLSNSTDKEPSLPRNEKIDWKQAKNSSVASAKIQNLQSGLYEITKTDKRGETDQGSAWILVVPSNKFRMSFNEFAKLKKTVNRWQAKKLNEETSAGLIRAGLSYISQEVK